MSMLRPEVPVSDTAPAVAAPQRRWRAGTIRRHRLGIVGIVLVVAVTLLVVVGPWLVSTDPNAQDLSNRLAPPLSDGALLGTDQLGRDLFTRILHGGRASLGVVLAAMVFGAGIGGALGVLAGYYGGKTDNVIMRLVDAQLALPTLVAAMFVAAVLGTGFWNTALTLGLASWPLYARLLRAEVLSVRGHDYLDAAIALGARDTRLVVRHVLPNILSAFCVVASLELGKTVLVEASLSYLGFGMQPPDASWGSMIRQGQEYVFTEWWLAAVPGVLIMVTVLGLNLLGDWLRDVLDPHVV